MQHDKIKDFILDKWGYIAGVLYILAIVASISIGNKVDGPHPQSSEERIKKQYSHELAGNVRYFDFDFIDRELFTFKNCRIRKLRRGAFTFGAFNVIEMDDLVINIPVVKAGASGGKDAEAEQGDTNSFTRVFSSFKAMGKKRFSGVEINRLTINKYLTASQYVRIEALYATCKFNRDLALTQCNISTDKQNKVQVRDAVIQFSPLPTLFYQQGGVQKKIEL